jgi:hypothetical protein
MMPADLVINTGLMGRCLHGCCLHGCCLHGSLVAVGDHASGRPAGRRLAVAALISWLLAEGLGAGMFRSWLANGGIRERNGRARQERQARNGQARRVRQARQARNGQERQERQERQDSVPPALIVGHAGLALGGFASWVSFLVTGKPALAWLAIGFLAPAIGLGVSTVTVWTPFPARRPGSGNSPGPPKPDSGRGSSPSILVTNEMLDQVLANEALTGKLVDDLVERMLTGPARPPPVSRGWRLAPVIPILHGVLAIATFLLAMLAAIAAVAGT